MTKIEAFRLAMAELGNCSSEELSDHIQKRYGLTIPVPYIPVFRATMRAEDEAKNASVNVTTQSVEH
ncbi:hypothetical protein KIH39_09960 [Telmatocola sphagniphila]|uniref:Uncharacterized protein n=1 Tax=Telmatocola sphagniphila TaxID=1123043 RepID=A0A8E6EZY1_9BACT|nr:hypothetical protein [Telmatocola sphagniphila]QVL34208.1 hypothetical protein KIH39_09960 [Telmatocola sphagniphila]